MWYKTHFFINNLYRLMLKAFWTLQEYYKEFFVLQAAIFTFWCYLRRVYNVLIISLFWDRAVHKLLCQKVLCPSASLPKGSMGILARIRRPFRNVYNKKIKLQWKIVTWSVINVATIKILLLSPKRFNINFPKLYLWMKKIKSSSRHLKMVNGTICHKDG